MIQPAPTILRANDVFARHEPVWTEPLLTLYTLLNRVFADHSDRLELTETMLRWSRDDVICGTFPLPSGAEPSFRMLFDTILARDVRVQHQLTPLSSDSHHATYHVHAPL